MSPKLSKLKTPNASTISTLKELINHSVFDALPDSGYLSSTLPARKWLISLETGVQSQTTKRV